MLLINQNNKCLDKSVSAMFLLKLETELEETIKSGKAFQILMTRFKKKFLSRSEATWILANLSELPRVEAYNCLLKKQEESISTLQTVKIYDD